MKIILAAFISLLSATSLQGQPLSVKSPDGRLEFTFSVENTATEKGSLFYSLSYRGKNVVLKSRLGIITVDLPSWVSGFTLTGHTSRSVDEIWKPVYGERSTVKDHYNECTVDLAREADKESAFQLIVRVYNEGAAFCYHYRRICRHPSSTSKTKRASLLLRKEPLRMSRRSPRSFTTRGRSGTGRTEPISPSPSGPPRRRSTRANGR
jgi:hypothetical protein